MELLVLFGSLILCISLSVPIGFSIAISTTLAFILFTDTPLTIIAQTGTTGLDSFPMLAIPLFILSGILMTRGGVASRLVNMAQAFVGHITGGLGMVMAISCMFFGSISGSAPATVSAIGGMLIPEMKKKGYPLEFSSSLAAAAGSIGLIIPPSIAFVVYGVATNTSIGDLFIAAIIPGVLMTLALCICSYILAKKNHYPRIERTPVKEIPKVVWEAKWAIIAPVIVLGGIYTGFFTPTESAAVTCVYSFIIGKFVHKELGWKETYYALRDSMVLNGIILFMLGLATGFARYLSLAQVPAKLTHLITSISENPFIIMLLINVILLMIGCILDNIPVIIILAPLLLPIASGVVGLTPIQFGVIMVLNTTIGLCTPPYGPNIFIACSVAGIKMEQMIKPLLVFLLALLVVLAIVTYVPGVTTVLLK